MSKLSRNTARFFLRNRDRGIPHLLMGIAVIRLLVLFLGAADNSGLLISKLFFLHDRILRGEVWRMFSYILVPSSDLFWSIVSLMFYFFMDQSLELALGRLKTNLYVLCTTLLLSLSALVLGAISPSQTSMFIALSVLLDAAMVIAWAAVNPNTGVMLMMIIPLKMKYLAWVELAYLLYYLISWPFPTSLIALIPLLPLFLFLRRDAAELLPDALRNRVRRTRKRPASAPKFQKGRPVIREVKRPYRHKCTVCGRTDTDFPNLEFRYCSRCSGYYCYCSDHINNHVHIVDAEPTDPIQ